MLKALYEIPQVLHLSVYEMQKVLCLDMSLISKYPSMYMYVLQSVQYSDHVDMLQSLQYSDHVYAHIMKFADRTCLVSSLPRNIQLVQGLLNTTKKQTQSLE